MIINIEYIQKHPLIAAVFSFLLAACTVEATSDDSPHQPYTIEISASYPTAGSTTRVVIDGGFVPNDQIGLFVDYMSSGKVNDISNVRFTLEENSHWQPSRPLYWTDDTTKANFYAYYPYDASMDSPSGYVFSVSERQDGEPMSTVATGYASSDLLVARQACITPTKEQINLQFHHLMAGVTISLVKGDGFTLNEWEELQKTVLLKHLRTTCTVNLKEGTSELSNEMPVHTIVPLIHNKVWRAVVPPQSIDNSTSIISVTIDGKSYELRKDETVNFVSGKMHQFTITVNRQTNTGELYFELQPMTITTWVDDSQMHEGLVREYLVVDMAKEGTLQTALKNMGVDYREVNSLKVTGNINQTDLNFMGQEMKRLTDLNLSGAVIVGNTSEIGVITGFSSHEILHHIQLPEKGLKKIGFRAFSYAGLIGSLVIPEGVEVIDIGAFEGCKCTGTLSLPSTLKHIGEGAFAYCRFSGELKLPEGLEYISPDIANGAYPLGQGNYTGTLTLPSTLKTVGFLGYSGLRGDIVIPDTWTEISELRSNRGIFDGGGFDGRLILPEGLVRIGNRAFAYTKICGEVKVPESCKFIGQKAFAGTRINSIILPENLLSIASDCFYECDRLSGTITWPQNINRVSDRVFYGCRLLAGVVLHRNVSVIGSNAFFGCFNMQSIVCKNEEPPLVGENAFLGMSKGDVIVEVPQQSIEKYRQADGWRDFKRIVAIGGLGCRPSSLCALNKGLKKKLIVDTKDKWTVIHQPDWCQLTSTCGTGKTEVQVSVSSLAHGEGNRQDSIVFQSLTDGTIIWCKVAQYDYNHEEDSYLALQTATKGNNGGINIVFLGDGWDGKTISNGEYLNLTKYQTECFFAIEPYRSMREYFNVYVTFPLSQEKGVNTMYTYVNNRFGTLYGRSSMTDGEGTYNKLITEIDEVFDYAMCHTPVKQEEMWQTLIILVPNTTDYEGDTKYSQDGQTLSICPPSDLPYPRDTRGVIQHEAGGHGFGKLGDESFTKNAFAPTKERRKVEEMHDRGWYQNLATTSMLHDVPWAEFIFDPYYSDRVDIYEGGYGYTRLIYRPESNSCMNSGIPYYNAPSRLDIYKRIKQYAGEKWSMEEFRAQDTFEWGPTTVTRGYSLASPQWDNIKQGMGYAENNRHVMPCIVNFKKMGNEVRAIRNRLKNERTKYRR